MILERREYEVAQSKEFNNINQFLLLFFIILLAAHRLAVTVRPEASSKKPLVYTPPFTSEITNLLLTILTGKANGCSQC